MIRLLVFNLLFMNTLVLWTRKKWTKEKVLCKEKLSKLFTKLFKNKSTDPLHIQVRFKNSISVFLNSSITFCSGLLNAGICFTNISLLGVSIEDTRQLLTETPRMTKTLILGQNLAYSKFYSKIVHSRHFWAKPSRRLGDLKVVWLDCFSGG